MPRGLSVSLFFRLCEHAFLIIIEIALIMILHGLQILNELPSLSDPVKKCLRIGLGLGVSSTRVLCKIIGRNIPQIGLLIVEMNP